VEEPTIWSFKQTPLWTCRCQHISPNPKSSQLVCAAFQALSRRAFSLIRQQKSSTALQGNFFDLQSQVSMKILCFCPPSQALLLATTLERKRANPIIQIFQLLPKHDMPFSSSSEPHPHRYFLNCYETQMFRSLLTPVPPSICARFTSRFHQHFLP
jgi:hypothetical protein